MPITDLLKKLGILRELKGSPDWIEAQAKLSPRPAVASQPPQAPPSGQGALMDALRELGILPAEADDTSKAVLDAFARNASRLNEEAPSALEPLSVPPPPDVSLPELRRLGILPEQQGPGPSPMETLNGPLRESDRLSRDMQGNAAKLAARTAPPRMVPPAPRGPSLEPSGNGRLDELAAKAATPPQSLAAAQVLDQTIPSARRRSALEDMLDSVPSAALAPELPAAAPKVPPVAPPLLLANELEGENIPGKDVVKAAVASLAEATAKKSPKAEIFYQDTLDPQAWYLQGKRGRVRLSTKDRKSIQAGGLSRQMRDWAKKLGFDDAQIAAIEREEGTKAGD